MRGTRKRQGINSVGWLLEAGLSGLDIAGKVREHTAPLVWAEAVGPQIAGATEVLGIEGGVLRVSTRSAAWSSELSFRKAQILRELNSRIDRRSHTPHKSPAVTDILFFNRGIRDRTAPPQPPPLAPTPEQLDDIELTDAEIQRVEAGIATIADPLLHARLRRVRCSDLRLTKWREENGWQRCAGCGDLAPSATDAPDAPISCARCRLARNRNR